MIWYVWNTQKNNYAVSWQYLTKELSYKFNVLHAHRHKSLLQVDTIVFDGLGYPFSKYPGKFAISLWHLKKNVREEVRDLPTLADSNTTLTTHYTFNVFPLLTFFLSQYWIHTKSFLHLINCLCNITSLLLFQAISMHVGFFQWFWWRTHRNTL